MPCVLPPLEGWSPTFSDLSAPSSSFEHARLALDRAAHTQRALSRLCRQVLPVYDGRNWAYIEEHLHDVLGKQLREGGGQLHEAARHFMAHLPCAHNSEGFQGYYLQQFLDTVQEAGAAGVGCPSLHAACLQSASGRHPEPSQHSAATPAIPPYPHYVYPNNRIPFACGAMGCLASCASSSLDFVRRSSCLLDQASCSSPHDAVQSPLPPLELPVPIVDVAHVRVRHEGQVCHADAHAPSQPEQLWKALEQPMVPGA